VMFTADRTRGIVLLSNGPQVADIAGHVLNPAYPLTPPLHLAALTDEQIGDYVGTYVNKDAGITYVITHQGQQVIAQIAGQPEAPIFASRPDHFFYTAVPAYVEFVRQGGRVVGLILTQGGQMIPLYKEGSGGELLATHLEPSYPPVVMLDQPTLQSYVGSYVHAGYTYLVTLADGHLFAKLATQPAFEIYPSAKDHFYYKVVDAQVDFARDASGKVVTLTLHQNGRDSTYVRN